MLNNLYLTRKQAEHLRESVLPLVVQQNCQEKPDTLNAIEVKSGDNDVLFNIKSLFLTLHVRDLHVFGKKLMC